MDENDGASQNPSRVPSPLHTPTIPTVSNSEPQRPTHSQIALAALPASIGGSILGALFIFTANWSNLYSSGLFCLVPFLIGFLGVICLRSREPSLLQILALTGYSLLYIAIAMLVFAFEGVICILMAAPLAVPLAFLGGVCGIFTKRWISTKLGPRTTYSVVPILPLIVVIAARQSPTPETCIEKSSIVIDAPASKIWPMLLTMDRIEGPEWGMFQAGIAHPISVRSYGSTLGSKRECVLSTGTMPERIVAMIPTRLLRFEVIETPPTMKEWNPFAEIETRHLIGYYNCRFGEFRLEPLTANRTRLTGTSWYDFRIFPGCYWKLWTDSIVEHVHLRVMEAIKSKVTRQ